MPSFQGKPKEFVDQVILPALATLGLDPNPRAAAQLLLGTAIQESNLHFRRQLGDGPARGLFQMEPATHDDIWANFLKFNTGLGTKVASFLGGGGPSANALENNDLYAAAMARAHYRRVSAPLPAADDIAGMGAYWKAHYNTPLGAGTAQEFIDHYQQAVQGNFPQ
jgi:hypothetical protein